MPIHLNINDEDHIFTGGPMTPLLEVLRDTLLLTGAKNVCGEGFCGACMVHIDGVAKTSCLVPVGLAAGKRVVTIEGLRSDAGLTPLQQKLQDFDAVQCGMCFPGMVMTLSKVLEENPAATRDDIKRGLSGNVCRCTGYEQIIDAALSLQHVEEASN